LKKSYRPALEPRAETSPIQSKYIFQFFTVSRLSTITNPGVNTTGHNRSNASLNTLLRKIACVYPVNYKMFKQTTVTVALLAQPVSTQ
jgi:hypothetical protein